MDLSGKGVFLTGGARGLGRGMTEALLSKGAKFGAVDICINNAGIIDERVWEKMFAVNTVAQIRGSQLALDHMRRDRGGRGGLIINTVSVS
ncbi:hypothetical protein BaRGS_00037662, partial [Batillaria attramentaria]